MYTVTEHRQLGFVPKDKEKGIIPLADFLVKRQDVSNYTPCGGEDGW
ncbi:MAG TPA: hypothetical protein VI320_31580 [Terracidiphilus sp.]